MTQSDFDTAKFSKHTKININKNKYDLLEVDFIDGLLYLRKDSLEAFWVHFSVCEIDLPKKVLAHNFFINEK